MAERGLKFEHTEVGYDKNKEREKPTWFKTLEFCVGAYQTYEVLKRDRDDVEEM